MAARLERRVRALEMRSGGIAQLKLSQLTDRELATRILQIELGRNPTVGEVDDEMKVLPDEVQRRNAERLAAVRRQLWEMS